MADSMRLILAVRRRSNEQGIAAIYLRLFVWARLMAIADGIDGIGSQLAILGIMLY